MNNGILTYSEWLVSQGHIPSLAAYHNDQKVAEYQEYVDREVARKAVYAEMAQVQLASDPPAYDTGEVMEPFVWDLDTTGDFGKVDFEDDQGATVATVRMVRKNGGYVLEVDSGVTVTVEMVGD